MRRPDRLELKSKIVEKMGEMEWPHIDLILNEFNLWTSDTWNGQKIAYVVRALQNIDDADLLDIGEHFKLTASALQPVELAAWDEKHPIWQKGMFRLFLSHVTSYKEFAGDLKEELAERGVDVFVAHEDIQPSDKWLDTILEALRSCDAFAALLTDDFRHSVWTDQEFGFALARGIPIWPLKLAEDPHGFMAQHQALGCHLDRPDITAEAIYCKLRTHATTATKIRFGVAAALRWSTDFSTSIRLAKRLRAYEQFEAKDLQLLKDALSANGQVSAAFGVPKILNEILEKHASKLDVIPF